jgi:hypothetical protein
MVSDIANTGIVDRLSNAGLPAPATVIVAAEYFGKETFLAALSNPQVIDFDSLAPESVFDGNAFAAQGVVISQIDGDPMRVVSTPPIFSSCSSIFFSTTPNAISSTWSGTPLEGYPDGGACGLYFNVTHSDRYRFTFTTPVSAAVYLSAKTTWAASPFGSWAGGAIDS